MTKEELLKINRQINWRIFKSKLRLFFMGNFSVFSNKVPIPTDEQIKNLLTRNVSSYIDSVGEYDYLTHYGKKEKWLVNKPMVVKVKKIAITPPPTNK